MKYQEYKVLDLAAIDKQMLEFWKNNQIFEKSMTEREGCPSFVFFEGPPSANGKPGIHHVLARTVKDTFCRFQTMKGKQVRRKAGWDTHGLPIELAVEKKLGITKEDIGKKISVDDYNKACKETVMMYKDLWDDLTRKMGYWVDMTEPYVTYENNYIESCWWLLNKLYNTKVDVDGTSQSMLYKGYTIQPYSPAAGTGLSTHELNQPGCYKDVSDTTVVAQFKAKYTPILPSDTYFIAWTTTPWTLPSNTALCVGPKINYVLVKTFNQYTGDSIHIILAKNLVNKQLSGKYSSVDSALGLAGYNLGDKLIPFYLVQEFTGEQLVGIEYEQLLPYAQPHQQAEKAFRVISGNFVTTADGTGIVHIAPTFGADDAFVAKEWGIPPMLVMNKEEELVPLVDLQGRFRPEMGEFAGKYVKNEYYPTGNAPDKSIDVQLAIKLKIENKAFKVEKYRHSYPHCWRTDKPVLYYPLDSWFVRATAKKKRMSELNKTINWKPKATGEKRFGGWLDNLQDWNLSRSRYWGIPLPIWRSEDGTEECCIDSIASLKKAIENANSILGMQQEVPKDLHRPYIDEVILVSKSGQKMIRETDLIDVWFDSGSMPYAQWHYPFENKELIDNALNGKGGNVSFPADFIAEGVDQTRGWFYTLHAIATMCFDSVAYKNVVSNGLVLAKDGLKMSKSKGNAIEPFETLSKHGADATRWYMLTNAQPWDNLKFDEIGLDETRRKLFGTLYNTYNFFATYANVDAFDGFNFDTFSYGHTVELSKRPEIDRWIISLLNSLIKEVDSDLSNYEPTNAGRKIVEFVDKHLSNWYVRLCRRRFWKGEKNVDKLAAYQTLNECLLTLSKLMAPIAPFFSDWLYGNLNNVIQTENHLSVHLCFFPKVQHQAIDQALEQRMSYAQRITTLVLSLRKKEAIRVRQPLQKILLPVLNESFKHQVQAVEDLILSELNIKEFEYVSDASGIIKKGIKPNFKTLGKRLGKNMKAGKNAIDHFTQQDIAQIEKDGHYNLNIEGASVQINLDDVIITSEDIEGWMVANDAEITVALDVHITSALKAEGIAREIVNRVQNLRKDKEFDVTDRITLSLQNHEAIQEAMTNFKDYICAEVLATELHLVPELTLGEDIDLIDDIKLKIQVVKN